MQALQNLARAAVVVALLAIAPSCRSAIPQPALEWVVASRQTHDVIGPRFVAYVQADANLLPADKATLIELVDDWDLMIQAGEALYPPPAPAPTDPPVPAPLPESDQ